MWHLDQALLRDCNVVDGVQDVSQHATVVTNLQDWEGYLRLRHYGDEKLVNLIERTH